jgi:hypothetical protein
MSVGTHPSSFETPARKLHVTATAHLPLERSPQKNEIEQGG